MKRDKDQPVLVLKQCRVPSLSSYPVKYPTITSLTLRNFDNAVEFHPKEKLPCKDTWYRDLKSTHIRNRRLLDLPFSRPRCCSNIYNELMDRQKLKKVKKYGLTRPVRTHESELEEEKTCEEKICDAEEEIEDVKTIIFPECYEVSDFSSDEEDDEYEVCHSGSVSECSGCSTLGTGFMRSKFHKVIRKDIKGLLHSEANELCKAKIFEELTIHKMGQDFKLKLDKLF